MLKLAQENPVAIAYYNAQNHNSPSDWLLSSKIGASIDRRDVVQVYHDEFFNSFALMENAVHHAMSALDAIGVSRENLSYINLSKWSVRLEGTAISDNLTVLRNLTSAGLTISIDCGPITKDDPSVADLCEIEKAVSANGYSKSDVLAGLVETQVLVAKVLLPSLPIKPRVVVESTEASEFTDLVESEDIDIQVLPEFMFDLKGCTNSKLTNLNI